ncbi:MAG TPA: hypothetical protein VJP88_10450, partial [Caulobacteraceae bacterium]|nr:hypothetical protein [Caulobacteraceae bacterium]
MDGQGRSSIGASAAVVRSAESLLAFWAEAGVDAMFADAPIDRIAERPRPSRTPAAQP